MTTAHRHTQSSTTTETPDHPAITWGRPYDPLADVATSKTAAWAQFLEPFAITGVDVDSTTQEEYYYGILDSAPETVTLFSGRDKSNKSIVLTDRHRGHSWATLHPSSAPRVSEWKQVRKLTKILTRQDVAQSAKQFLSNTLLAYEYWPRTFSVDENLVEARRRLEQLLKAAGENDWDGEGGKAISAGTLRIAEDIANIIPYGIDIPEISATPHGEVDFDWIVSSKTMMTVSACPSGEIAFAALFENARVRDRRVWSGRLDPLLSTCFGMLRAAYSEVRR